LGTRLKTIPSLAPLLTLAILSVSCSSQIEKLDSEGVLLAEFVRGGHSTAEYTRGHAQFLASQCEDLLSDLNKLDVGAEEQQQLRELRALATKLAKATIDFPTEHTQMSELDNVREQFVTVVRAAERIKVRP
jgi:hypothetical protein